MDANGFKHFVPALARLAYGTGRDLTPDRVLHYFTRDRIAGLSARQRAAVEALLLDLSEVLTPDPDGNRTGKLDCALRRVRGQPCPSDERQDRILARDR
jgi:hypothetical protein